MEELIKASTMEQLEALLVQYKDKQSIVDMVSAGIKAKKQALADIEAEAQFQAGLELMLQPQTLYTTNVKATAKAIEVGLPKPPSTIHNVYFAWAEVEQDDTSKPQTEVVIQDKPAEAYPDGTIKAEAITHIEKRYPQIKVWQWVVTLNKGFAPLKGNQSKGSTTNMPTKRSITVKRINGTQVETIANYSTGAAACKDLGLNPASGSANLCLRNNGYLVEPYIGTEIKL